MGRGREYSSFIRAISSVRLWKGFCPLKVDQYISKLVIFRFKADLLALHRFFN